MNSPILRFLGGAGTVTGSKFLVDSGRSQVLVDCGLFQGSKSLRVQNWEPFPIDPALIDAVVLTHAHLDHVGYLPALVRDGFSGPVWCSPYTAELAAIVLADSARLQEEEAGYANKKRYSKHHPALPLYTQEDAAEAIALMRTVPFGATFEVANGLRGTMAPAGHILGAATVTLELVEVGRRVLFTGDLGRETHPLLLPPPPPTDVDVIVCESTYGNRVHEDDEVAMDTLADAINRTAQRGGMIVMPAFAVDRTEVVLLALGRLLAEQRIPKLPIYADSPMALSVLDIYRRAVEDGAPEVRPRLQSSVFDGAGEVHEAHSSDESRELNKLHYPSIIISASGMATGGRVLHHLEQRLPDARNTVVLTGFQAEGTRGQLLASGIRSLKMLGHYVPVRAEIVSVGSFSVHADANDIVGWLGKAQNPPEVVYLVHGEPSASAALEERIEAELGWQAVVAAPDERVRLA